MEGKEVTFKRDVYADIYGDILGLMEKCDTNPIHRAKTKMLRVQWAKIGKYVPWHSEMLYWTGQLTEFVPKQEWYRNSHNQWLRRRS